MNMKSILIMIAIAAGSLAAAPMALRANCATCPTELGEECDSTPGQGCLQGQHPDGSWFCGRNTFCQSSIGVDGVPAAPGVVELVATHTRRECDDAIIRFHFDAEVGAELRSESNLITI